MAGTYPQLRAAWHGNRSSRPMREMQQSATAEGFVEGLDYPAAKSEILAQAREAKLPDDVVAAFEKIPDREYGDAKDLTGALNAG